MSLGLRTAMCVTAVAVSLLGLGCGWTTRPHGNIAIDQFTITINAVSHEAATGDSQWQKVCDVLNRYARVDCDEIEKTDCRQIGSVRVCDYKNIVLTFAPPLSLDEINRLHTELMALENAGVTLGVQFASLDAKYLGLTAKGTISVKVRIAVSPGATLYVERRWPGICEKVVTKQNIFNDEITLRKGQEWIHYRTELDTGRNLVERYFRLNILTRQEEELNREQFEKLIQSQ